MNIDSSLKKIVSKLAPKRAVYLWIMLKGSAENRHSVSDAKNKESINGIIC